MEAKPKKVVYLFGAGATQAEIDLIDNSIRTLTDDIRDAIFDKIEKDLSIRSKYPELMNQIVTPRLNVEHLITLFESSGNYGHTQTAIYLRSLFRQEIQQKLQALNEIGTGFSPKLYPALIDMHQIGELGEIIVGILTLNYDDFLERGVQLIMGGIDLAIKINSTHSLLKIQQNLGFPILKLHGSFNWKNEFPVTLVDDSNIIESEDVLWIPPGIEKRRERYPFSILWGRAREVLDCDILRVVGCSLNQNDWQLVSLLYLTQKLNTNKREYSIELINNLEACRNIKNNYNNINFSRIEEIPEIRISIAKSQGVTHKPEDQKSASIEQYLDDKRLNVLDLWLRAKGEYLQDNGVPLATDTKTFENYMKEKS